MWTNDPERRLVLAAREGCPGQLEAPAGFAGAELDPGLADAVQVPDPEAATIAAMKISA